MDAKFAKELKQVMEDALDENEYLSDAWEAVYKKVRQTLTHYEVVAVSTGHNPGYKEGQKIYVAEYDTPFLAKERVRDLREKVLVAADGEVGKEAFLYYYIKRED